MGIRLSQSKRNRLLPGLRQPAAAFLSQPAGRVVATNGTVETLSAHTSCKP